MKKLMAVLTLASGLYLASSASAQPAGGPPAPAPGGAAPGGTGTTANVDVTVDSNDPMSSATIDDVGTTPSTGGAPLAMSLMGLLTAGGAYFLRRKIS